MKKLILILSLAIFIPSVVFGAWYNPLSWFKKQSDNQTQTERLLPTNDEKPNDLITGDTSDKDKIIEQLKKTIAELEKQIKEYKCPACVQKPCPICPTSFSYPASLIFPKCPDCNCPTCPTYNCPISITPLLEIYSVSASVPYASKRTGEATGTISFKTNLPTNSKVSIWIDSSSKTIFNSTAGLSNLHSVKVGPIRVGKTYHYEIQSISSDNQSDTENDIITSRFEPPPSPPSPPCRGACP